MNTIFFDGPPVELDVFNIVLRWAIRNNYPNNLLDWTTEHHSEFRRVLQICQMRRDARNLTSKNGLK